MTTRNLLNIVLVFAIFALTLIAIYEPGLEAPLEPAKLTQLATGDVTRISIQKTDQDAITLVRDKGKWRMLEPLRLDANGFRVDNLLPLLASSSAAQYDASNVDLEKFGLKKPRLHATFNDTVIAFGDVEPLSRMRYVVINDTVQLINDNYYGQLNGDVSFFLDTNLLPSDAELTALQLPNVQLKKDSQGWKVVGGKNPGSADAVNALVDEWRNGRALKVSSYQPVRVKKVQTINLTLAERGNVSFDYYELGGEQILARKDLKLQYHLAKETLNRLLNQIP